jgi:hypothetical protein
MEITLVEIHYIQKYVCCKYVVNVHAYMGTLTVDKIKCLRSYKLLTKWKITPLHKIKNKPRLNHPTV